MLLTTTEQLIEWLDDTDGFANGELDYTFDALSGNFSFKIVRRPEVAVVAGEKELVTIFTVLAQNTLVLAGSLLVHEEDLVIYSLYPLDQLGLMIDIWGKDDISLSFTALNLITREEVVRIAKPVLSDTTVAFKIKIDQQPDAAYWINALQQQGHTATYSGYFGNEIPITEVTSYRRLSLRPKREDTKVASGINFSTVEQEDGLLTIVLETEASGLEIFWNALMKVINELNIVEARSGNVVFTADEWREFLQTKELPVRLL
jgi:hypothetical protein